MKKIKIAHSPDTDDIFMFYALKESLIPKPDWDFEFVAEDIGILNNQAKDEIYDITALSFHAYAHVSDQYAILSSGASLAEKEYGPLIVTTQPKNLADLTNKKIAVPGLLTTATLLLRMMLPQFTPVPMPANAILDAVCQSQVDAGLIIHEGQIHYQNRGLHIAGRVIEYWKSFAGSLPLPLGLSAVKKSLGQEQMQSLARLQKQSIQYAFDHRTEALAYARLAAPELSLAEADHYLEWYANKRTLNLGTEERLAMLTLFNTAFAKGLIPKQVKIEIITG